MTRELRPALWVLAVLLGWLAYSSPPIGADPVPMGAVRIQDRIGSHFAAVNSSGQLSVDATVNATVDTISHITSAVHVAGIAQTVQVDCISGCSASSSTHTAVSQTAQPWTIQHISSALHIAGIVPVSGTVAATQSGAYNVSAAQSGAWTVEAHQAGSWTVTATQSGAYNVSSAQSGSYTVQAAHQAGEWNVRHVSAAAHVAGYTNITRASPAPCHSRATFSQLGSAAVIHVGAGWSVSICSIVAVTSAAQSVAVVEGTGSVCGTNTVGIVGGPTASEGVPLSANAGFSSISGVPWVGPTVAGNSVCILQSGSDRIAGTVTYRGHQ